MDQLSDILWYNAPADNWDEALPVGNGRIGGMVFGRPGDELIQLNEDSIWSGGFRKRNNPKALGDLEKMRELLKNGKTSEAEALCFDSFMGTNENQRHYQPMGDLHIWQSGAENISGYKRSLDLNTALCVTEWQSEDILYKRTVYVSFPDQVMVIRFTASEKGRISFTSAIDGKDDDYDRNEAYDGNTILFTMSDGIPYSTAVSCASTGGRAFADANRLKVENADEAVIVLACQTAFRTGDHEKLAVSQAKAALRKSAENLEVRHVRDHSSLYERCTLSICDNSEGNAKLPTDERLKKIREGKKDNKLIEMYFNYSKYLMIAGSREGSLPLNLQGIWNKDMWPAWGCKYTVNINTEMNYWAAEVQNLPECHTPLFDHIERMRENGRVTAREMYGCRGTVCHHNTDIWGDTAPQDKWLPGTQWPMGMAWLCLHIYDHYLFTGDKKFLTEKYDTMREAAEFFMDFLIDDGTGRLVTSPSVSPENTYITADGKKGTVCQGPSMDSQILYALFTALIRSSEVIDPYDRPPGDVEFIARIKILKERLPKPTIGKYGQIMEWAEDYDEAEPGHRHISQLFALCPGEQITKHYTPELAKAAKATLLRRLANGGGHTGWSRAWIINMWARLYEKRQVSRNITELLAHSTNINLLDMHPPFQIDGNFGGGAGIAEAVVQSHNREIKILPAVPGEWKSGYVKGIMARGGFELSFSWKDGRVETVTMKSLYGSTCRIAGSNMSVFCGFERIYLFIHKDATIFDTKKGKEYRIEFHYEGDAQDEI